MSPYTKLASKLELNEIETFHRGYRIQFRGSFHHYRNSNTKASHVLHKRRQQSVDPRQIVRIRTDIFKNSFLQATTTNFQVGSHYDFQIRQQHQPSTFYGPAQQFGSGGMGAFAIRMGRVAMPLVKKYVVPVAKEFGKKLVSSVVPDFSNNISGKKRPRKDIGDVLKQSANKTIAKAIETRGSTTGAVAAAAGGRSGGARNTASARATGHPPLESVRR